MKLKLCTLILSLLSSSALLADEFLPPVTMALMQPFGNDLGNSTDDFNLAPSPENNGLGGPTDFSAPSLTTPSPNPAFTVPNNDPVLNNTQPFNPYQPITPGPAPTQGLTGAQPYQFGWKQRYDVGWLPGESANPNLGDFEIIEFDAEWEYSSPFAQYWIMTNTPQLGFRWWDGPTSSPIPTRTLPSEVYRFGWDFELETPANGPWSFQLGFTPAIVTDLQDNLTSDGYNWDGRGIVFYHASPVMTYALGVGFWDRVDDQWIPYAGFIWTPSPRWEFRIMSPESRISYFMGHFMGYKPGSTPKGVSRRSV
ncbi:MAG: hypothetical protein R3C11_12370 [Planctomycetaceae bacterium]